MTTGLMVKHAGGELATADAMLSKEEMSILKATICKDATDQELLFFSHVCRSKQLDPFGGEIFLVKRDGKPVIQTGIDGFRAQAERSGNYAGSDEPVYEENAAGHPEKCSVTVYKIVLGARVPFTATIRWNEFYPGDKVGFMWRAKPFHMLGKCAEAQALRKAFPRQLAGMHIPEEMESAISEEQGQTTTKAAVITEKLASRPAAAPSDATALRLTRVIKAFEKFGKTEKDIVAFLGVSSMKDITDSMMNRELAAWYDGLVAQDDDIPPPAEEART